MKTIQASDLTDEHWQAFALFENSLMREFYPEYWDGKDPEREKVKNKYLNEVSLTDNSFSNSFFIFNDNKVIAFIDAYERRGKLFFVYNYSGRVFTPDILKIIFKEINNIISQRNKDEAFFYTFYERHYEPLLKAEVEIEDEALASRLLKSDIDFTYLNMLIDENKFAGNYELKLFREIPEEIYEQYIYYMNEIRNDKNEFHPKKIKSPVMTMNDLITRVKDMKDEKDIFYMYALFDEDKIAAFCSVCIDTIDKKPAIEHRGNLTSVGRNYRGKNFAKYLKAKMYLKIQEDYPDFEQIITDTYPWNKYMYRINEEFGFKPYQKGYSFRFTKEFIKKYLRK